MGRAAWVTLGASTVFTCCVIYYVHYSQKRDREKMREGIFIDLDRQQRKLQNVRQLELQSDLTKILRQQQKDQDERDKLTGNSS